MKKVREQCAGVCFKRFGDLNIDRAIIGTAAKQPDGSLLARRIGVGRDVAPPM